MNTWMGAQVVSGASRRMSALNLYTDMHLHMHMHVCIFPLYLYMCAFSCAERFEWRGGQQLL